MAYPSVNGPYGLIPVKLLSGVPFVGVTREYSIASAYDTSIFNGDAVTLVTGGTVERDTADAAMTPIGVFLGCSYTDPTLGYKVFSQYYPADTAASDIKAIVADGTDILFKVAVVSSGTTIGDLAITDIGANVAMVNNAGDTTTGNSKNAISDTSATTATLPLRIVDLVEETRNSSGGYTEALVKWNAGHQFNNTTGV
ncbi:hypothetical protein N9D02_10515 [Emcibacteraceae bacterium]|jgi:hypothetical protein|nr:hypothetical protein [Emcibacteraceae bacterium]